MNTLATLTRHGLTYLAGLVAAWFAIYLTGDDLKTATDALHALIEPLAVSVGFAAVVVTRLALPWLQKIFRLGAGDNDGSAGGPALFLLWLTCMTAALGWGLSSCSHGQFPVRVGLEGPGYAADYSAKSGLTIRAVVRDSGK
jgi:hypothetical protein